MKLLSGFVFGVLAAKAAEEREMHPDTRALEEKSWDEQEETTGSFFGECSFFTTRILAESDAKHAAEKCAKRGEQVESEKRDSVDRRRNGSPVGQRRTHSGQRRS